MTAVPGPTGPVKDLPWPWLWVGLWLTLVGLVIWLSLGAPPPPTGVPEGDKWGHLLAYGGLALVAVQVFRPGRPLLVVLGATVALGVLLEIAQGTLTDDRMMDPRDAIANTLGVTLGGLTALTAARDLLRAGLARVR